MASAGQSQAFMPTPNDSLVSPAANGRRSHSNSSYTPRAQSLTNMSKLFSNESALLSPSDASESDFSTLSPSASNHWHPPGREQVPSASQVPGATATSAVDATPADEGFWFGLYNAATEVHEKEREVWKRERIRLMQEVQSLKEELTRLVRIGSGGMGVTSAGGGGGVGGYSREGTAPSVSGKENDKIFYNPQTVRDATEKLRQYSVVSPKGDASSSGRISREANDTTPQDSSGGILRRTTSFSRGKLSSISEDAASGRGSHVGVDSPSVKRVSISDILAEDEARMSPTQHPGIEVENPSSPPPTAAIMTPPPANFIMHAGHTPLAPRARSKRDSFDMAEKSGPSEVAALEETTKKIMRGALAGDEDPELASPKFLPSEPKGNVASLTTLDQLLQDVAEHPEENTPEVLRGHESSVANDSHMNGEQQAQNTSNTAVGGIRLKTSRSLNFGAELGSLR